MALVWLFLLSLVFACIYWIYCRLQFVRCFDRFPGPRAWPIIGNSLILMTSQADFLRLLMTEGKKSVNGTLCLWVGMRPFVFLHKHDVIKPLVTSYIHTEKNFEYTLSKDWLGEGLITSTGAKWTKHRKLLTPCFHNSILKDFSETVWKQTNVFVNQLRLNSDKGGEIIIFPFAKRLALDLICETALGTSVNAQLNVDSDYVLAIQRLADIMCRRFITPLLKPNLIFNMTPLGWEQKKLLKIIHGFVKKVIEERKALHQQNNNQNINPKSNKCAVSDIKDIDIDSKKVSDLNKKSCNSNAHTPLICKSENNNHLNVKNEKYKNLTDSAQKNSENHTARRSNEKSPKQQPTALLDLLLDLAQQDNTISETDILDEVNTFMFAGHDTVASAISFTLFTLGHNPEWQDKIVEEIKLICPDLSNKDPSFDKINELKVLDRCIKEALRLYPVAPLVGRTIRSPLATPAGVLVPGTTAVMNILLLHRDADVFSNPEKFDPDRFLPQNMHTNPYAYIPFSAGPRNCIGKRLALLELKIVLAMVLTQFEVTSVQVEEELQLSFEIVLFCANDLKLVLKKRTQNCK